jgi:hypothetical protein
MKRGYGGMGRRFGTGVQVVLLSTAMVFAMTAAPSASPPEDDALAKLMLERVEKKYPVLVSFAFRRALARCMSDAFAGLGQEDRNLLAATNLEPPEADAKRFRNLVPDMDARLEGCNETVGAEDFPYDPLVRGIDPDPPALMPRPDK